MRLQEIMNKNVRTIAPGKSADAAWEVMQQQDIHHLAVMENGELIGVISERDLGGRRGPSVRRGQTVLDLMTPHTITAKPDASIKQAANLLRGHVIGCLPVVENGKLLGIVTTSDLLELLGRGLEKPVARTERAMLSRRQGASPKRRH
jgi:acetoin utilization protein AcuB